MTNELAGAPWGYDSHTITETHTSVVPRPPPVRLHWTVGPVRPKSPTFQPRTWPLTHNTTIESEITVQLTADQQVDLTVGAQDAYGNEVDITGADVTWASSDESIISLNVDRQDETKATAVAVGPTGTASVTVSGGKQQQYQGSLAIDVVAGDVTEIVVEAGTPVDKQ